jgi:hypothetical protein
MKIKVTQTLGCLNTVDDELSQSNLKILKIEKNNIGSLK